jgi:hypothetical protein
MSTITPSTISDAAESAVHALSGAAHDVMHRVEDIPRPHLPQRHRDNRRRALGWSLVAIVVAGAVAWKARSRHKAHVPQEPLRTVPAATFDPQTSHRVDGNSTPIANGKSGDQSVNH